ncbi:MAG: HEAT repeat domain-containing protein [Planctomycetales bacterium]|nr:HEAT repeat domain-containing protein [Planctomycetales bacterium]
MAPNGPHAPTGPRASGAPRRGAGLDWRDWWGRQRLVWLPDKPSSARTPGAAPSPAERAEDLAYVAALEGLSKEPFGPSERAAVAFACAYSGDPRLLPLAMRLVADKDERTREAAVFALWSTASSPEEVAPAFVRILRDPSADEFRRGAAAAGLGFVGERAAVPEMRAILADRRAPLEVRSGVAFGLALLGEREAIPAIVAVGRDRREVPRLRAEAVAKLGLMARHPSSRAAAGEALRDLLSRPDGLDAGVRQSAALCLGRAEPSRATVECLAKVLRLDPDPTTRACAAIGLGFASYGEDDARRAARAALLDRWDREPPDVRAFLALGLGLGRHAGARETLEALLGSGGDPRLRGAAAVALGLLADRAALPALERVAGSGDEPGLRAEAAEALAMISGPEALRALRRLAGETSPLVRGAVLYGLGRIGLPADDAALASGLGAGSPDVRHGAILGWAARGGTAARDRLLAHARAEALPELRSLSILGAGIASAARPIPILDRRPDLSPWVR